MTEQDQVRLSRELDLKVARLVMGYAHFRFTHEDGTTFVQLMTREDANTRYIRILNPIEVESGDEDNAPRYSTEIALAFQVVEKMREKGWYCVIETPGALPSCSARFGHLLKPRQRHEYRDPAGSVTRCICMSAISAVQARDAR